MWTAQSAPFRRDLRLFRHQSPIVSGHWLLLPRFARTCLADCLPILSIVLFHVEHRILARTHLRLPSRIGVCLLWRLGLGAVLILLARHPLRGRRQQCYSLCHRILRFGIHLSVGNCRRPGCAALRLASGLPFNPLLWFAHHLGGSRNAIIAVFLVHRRALKPLTQGWLFAALLSRSLIRQRNEIEAQAETNCCGTARTIRSCDEFRGPDRSTH